MLDIHDKYYNKCFMSKVPQKMFGKDSKYKLMVRMQEVSSRETEEGVVNQVNGTGASSEEELQPCIG